MIEMQSILLSCRRVLLFWVVCERMIIESGLFVMKVIRMSNEFYLVARKEKEMASASVDPPP